jgi:membrane protein DedA with SNARE-associated domain
MWFLLAGPAGRFLERSQKSRAKYEKLVGWVSRRFGGRPERALLFVKFIYGARIATITLLALGGLSLRRFLALNSVGTAVWIVVMVAVGWLAGRGVGALASGLSRLEYAIPLFLILTLVVRWVVTSASKRAIER